ncbi:MAG TPA: hypothetical protein VN829_25000 [Dongiaceae bacterium]|nr:hypothetical protein [Dongiaceae bacterium]
MNRKPDGRSQLNRLSPDRQAAVADYAASYTLPETVEWPNTDSQRSKLKLGLDVNENDPARRTRSPFHGAGQNSSLPRRA